MCLCVLSFLSECACRQTDERVSGGVWKGDEEPLSCLCMCDRRMHVCVTSLGVCVWSVEACWFTVLLKVLVHNSISFPRHPPHLLLFSSTPCFPSLSPPFHHRLHPPPATLWFLSPSLLSFSFDRPSPALLTSLLSSPPPHLPSHVFCLSLSLGTAEWNSNIWWRCKFLVQRQ